LNKQNFNWLITLLLGVLIIDFYFQFKVTGWHFYDSKWFMWRMLFIAILIFFVLLKQLQVSYKNEEQSIYFIIKELYKDKYLLTAENQNLQFLNHNAISLDSNISFLQRLSNYISKFETFKNININFSFQENPEISCSLFLQFLISEVIKIYLTYFSALKPVEINIELKKIEREFISLLLVASFNGNFKISNNLNQLKQIAYSFNGSYKTRKNKNKSEIEIILPESLN
jgi:hypothetical protein